MSIQAKFSRWTIGGAGTLSGHQPHHAAWPEASFFREAATKKERPDMINRVFIAGLLGGVAMFIWGSVSHMALGLEESAVKDLPNEGPITAAMQVGIKEPGFYFFPGMEVNAKATKEEKAAAQKKWNEKYAAGPRGVVIFHPTGQNFNFPKKLALQLAAKLQSASFWRSSWHKAHREATPAGLRW